MGKCSNKLLYLILPVILILAMSPLPAYGAQRNSSLLISDYEVNAEILKDGSMSVSEKVTFEFSEKYNGVTKEIVYRKSSGISNLEVSEISEGTKKLYNLVGSASNGESGVYTVDKSSKDSWMLKIYSPSKNQSRTFLISYTLKNVAVRYNDIGELNWNFIGKENNVPIKSVLINIKVPEGAKDGDLRVFGHGPLSGQSSIQDNRTVNLSVNSLPAGTSIEARVLFPNSLIPQSQNIVNENGLNRILQEEKKFADEANARRYRARFIVFFINIAAAVILISAPILAYILHIKYNKEPKPEFEGKYYRELPEDCTPAVMNIIYNFGSITTRDITATLMDLVRKKYLKIDIVKSETKKLFGTKIEEDYTFKKINDADGNLLDHEKFFLNWMVNGIGDGHGFTLDDIEHYSKSRHNAQRFISDYNAWCNMVKMDANDKQIFDQSSENGKWIGFACGLAEIILGVAMIVFGGLIGIAVIAEGVALLVFSLFIRRRTVYGATQYAKWKAFRRFLREFSNLKEASIPSLIIWEHYLVYAISLGVAKEVIKQLMMIIPREYYDTGGLTYLYMGGYPHVYNAFDCIDTISSRFERAANSALALAGSKDSSFLGGGGGFSSGDSGGGGGGGFGGF